MEIPDIITPTDLIVRWKSYTEPQQVTIFYQDNPQYQNACFSNFYRHKPFTFTIPDECGPASGDNVLIYFSEKAIMLCKASLMGDMKTYQKIKYANTPRMAKILGRQVTNFNEDLWQNNICRIAKAVITSKFTKVDGLKEVLLATGTTLIAEAAINDKIWGIGMDRKDPNYHYPDKWKGSNILGWALMIVRNDLFLDDYSK